MTYRLIITERAESLLEQLIWYLIYQLKNEGSAKHLIDNISKIYDRMEENPFQFKKCRDPYLKSKGYYEAIVSDMKYLIIFKIIDSTVYILGIFHESEKYWRKL